MDNIWLRHKKKIEIVLVVFILLTTGILITRNDEYYEKYELADGWDVFKDIVYTTDVNLLEKNISVDIKDEPVYIVTTIEQEIDNPMLVIKGYNVLIEVKVDGISVYNYGEERYSKNKSVGGSFHYVNLPEDYVGKRVSIRFVATETDAMAKISPVLLVNSSEYIKGYLRENLL